MENRREVVGAVWVRKMRNNEQFLSVNVKLDGKEYNLVAFKNSRKISQKQPDFRVYVSRPFGQQQLQEQQPSQEQVMDEDL